MTQSLAYLDFDLSIEPGPGPEFKVILSSPAGEARETFRLPFDALQLENALLKLRNALLASGGRRRKILSPEQQAVRDFGSELFDALLCGEVRSCFDRSRLLAENDDKGLRLKLRIGPPELAALPWEYLYDPRTGTYLVLSLHTPVVRYLELPRSARSLAVTPPLRVLAVVANPSDTTSLDTDQERGRIETALRPLTDEGWIEIDWLSPPTWRGLQRALRLGEYHIFHFVGHGSFDRMREEGRLIFEDDTGRADSLPATNLADFLADHRSLRLVILNACESAYQEGDDLFAGTATTLVRAGVPAVVAMQFTITDEAAIELSRSFYEGLADNLPVDAALSEARKAINMEIKNTVEWGTPVLYTHATDGRIFDLAGTPSPPKTKPEPLPPVFRLEKAGLEMVLIPASEFLIGNPEGEGDNNQRPQHTLTLPDYYIARTLVTNAQYARFVVDTGCEPPRYWKGIKPSGKIADHPVVEVSWYDAIAYAQWAGGALPSEVEWEKAARGMDDRRYPWGNQQPTPKLCNFDGNEGGTTPVGQYSSRGDSPYGVADMAGNVWEWTRSLWRSDWQEQDLIHSYELEYVQENLELEIGDHLCRVLRGGSFLSKSRLVRCTSRRRYYPNLKEFDIGFRLVVVPDL